MSRAAAAAVIAALLPACALVPESIAPPRGPAVVAVPPGQHETMTLRADGTVNFECRPIVGMAGAYDWVVDAPDAVLRHWSGLGVGRLYAGPTWQYRDGSKVTGRLLGTAPGGPGKLPEQLWQTVSAPGEGEFAKVTYIRRIEASGGVLLSPPPCTSRSVGQGLKAPYQARYVFYERRSISRGGAD